MRTALLALAVAGAVPGCRREAPPAAREEPAGASLGDAGARADPPAPAGYAVALAGDPLRTERRESGLVIETFADSLGEVLRAGQTGVIAFELRLASDGTVVDSSAKRHAHLRVPLTEGAAMPGLLEGLEGMHVGSMRRLLIPSRLGYGDVGRPPIPARADLVVDVVLVEIAGDG